MKNLWKIFQETFKIKYIIMIFKMGNNQKDKNWKKIIPGKNIFFNITNYSPLWPEIYKLIKDKMENNFDADIMDLSLMIHGFNDVELLNDKNKRDILRDTVVFLKGELIEIKKQNKILSDENHKLHTDNEFLFLDNQNLVQEKKDFKEGELYYRGVINNKDMNIADLSLRIQERDDQIKKMNETIMKLENELKKFQNQNKIYKNENEVLKARVSQLNNALYTINHGKNRMNQSNTGSKKATIISENNHKKLEPESPDKPVFRFKILDFFKDYMKTFIDRKKLEYPEVYDEILSYIWTRRSGWAFSTVQLRMFYNFKNISDSTLDRYLNYFVQARVLKKLDKGYYLILIDR